MDKMFNRKRKEKVRRGCSLFLSAAMVCSMLLFDGTAVLASEAQGMETYVMEASEEGSGTKMPETDAEETTKEEIAEEVTTKEEATKGETAKEETTKEETIKEETTKEETIKEETAKEGTLKEEQAGEKGTQEETTEETIGGEVTEEENGNPSGTDAEEAAGGEQDSALAEDTGLCAHHKEHTAECGYREPSEDGEGSPCTYVCPICPIEKLTAALPEADDVTGDNAEKVRAQLEKILALYTELSEEEQEQADISRCLELQEALERLAGQPGAKTPALIAAAVSYLTCDADGTNWKEETCTEYTEVSSDTATWSDGWYVASGAVTIDSRVTVTGNVSLVLTDGCTLEAAKGITVNSGNSLTVYAQSDGDSRGSLKATAADEDCAGIGGNRSDGGVIVINGGVVTAKGGERSAGIGGGGRSHSGGTVVVNRGKVTADGGGYGAGIGGGEGGNGDKATINGGEVIAAGGKYGGAGIGGGYEGVGGETTINGGKVTAKGGVWSAGIGGGGGVGNDGWNGGKITINGGDVEAVGGSFGAGIGGSCDGAGGEITITGGDVTAAGGSYGAGIGGGTDGAGGEITITGGTVTATGGSYGAGIGGGNRGAGGEITITGGTITATKGSGGSDIGGGESGSAGTVFISGAKVNDKMYYTVSFVVDATGTDMSNVNVPAQGIVDGGKAAEPGLELEGYTISGWFKDENYRNLFDFETEVITGTLTLYAKLEKSTDYIVEMTTSDDGAKKYTTIAAAWDALVGKTATIKVLKDVTTTHTLTVSSGMAVTVEMEEGVTFRNTAADCFQIDGGTLTLTGGTVVEDASGKSLVYAASGTLRITGGNYQSNAGNGLWINQGAEVRLSGGTIKASKTTLRYESPRTLKEMLDTQENRCAAFYDGSGNLVTGVLDQGEASGTYTVKTRTEHDYEWRESSETEHCQRCRACGREGEHGEHMFENGVCTVCQTKYAAQVEADGTTTSYVSLTAAWDALVGKTGTIGIKVLKDATTNQTLTVSSGMDVTVEIAEGVTLKNTAADCFKVDGGTLTLTSGTVIEEASGKSLVYAASGTLCITGGNYQSKDGNGLWIDQGAEVRLSGGTISASRDTLRYQSPRTLKDMLDTQGDKCVAFYRNSGDTLALDILDQETARGTYTVKQHAEHVYNWKNDEETQHYQYCSGCGKEINRGQHTFVDGVCTECGAEVAAKVEAEGADADSYVSIVKAWDAVQGRTAKMTILKDQSLTASMEIKDAATDVTMEMADGVQLNSTSDFFIVGMGKLTLNSGTYVSSGRGKSGIYMTDGVVVMNGGKIEMTGGYYSQETKAIRINGSGTLNICGGELKVTGSSGIALRVDKGTVTMTGGTLASTKGKALLIGEDSKYGSVGSLLGEEYNLYKDEKLLTSERDGKELGTGTYTVAKCIHNYQYTHKKGTTLHERSCSLCGAVDGELEPCSYVWSGGEKKAVCAACNSCLTVSVEGTEGIVYDGTEKKPSVTVMLDDGNMLAEDGYTVTYSNNINAGDGTASVTVVSRAFKGTYTQKFSISKAKGILTVPETTAAKTFGDAEFALNCSTNGDGKISYISNKEDVASVSADGTVRIIGAGTAEIKVSLAEGKNYTGAESAAVTVNVAKRGGWSIDAVSRRYLHTKEHTEEINLAGLLPTDCGTVTYGTPSPSGNVTWKAAPAVNGGKLSYALAVGNAGDKGTITIPVETQNYENMIVTVNVELTDRIPVSVKDGGKVTLKNDTLTYGEALSKLEFNEAVFVDSDQNTVEGTLTWKNPSEMPDAGAVSAAWVFTPSDGQYEKLEGNISITVKKAVPKVTAPSVADRVYSPVLALTDSDLSGGSAKGVDGKPLEGTWNWKRANIVPVVDNSGYETLFTPNEADRANYETVTVSIPVTVTKAVPYVAELPAAAGITYGDTLDTSALSGGTVLYGNGAGQAGSAEPVAGTFTWKEPSVKPAAADSGVTEYTIVFTPSDTANYQPVETKVKLTVNKVQTAPNIPDSAMDVPDSMKIIGDIALPEGWEWQEADRETALEAGAAVSAVAVYTGADRGNYEKEAVTINITVVKSSCDHMVGDGILYTGTGEKAPTCTEDGLGHRECTKCGFVMESGIVVPALGHDYTGEVTKEPTALTDGEKTYTCSRCGDTYTEPIPRITPEGLWISGLAPSITYTGSQVKPEGIRVYHGGTLLREKTEYTVSYKNNTKAGTAQVIVTGKGSYKGKATAEFTIEAVDLGTDTNISAIVATAAETGKNLKPAVTVTWNGRKLKEKTDYTLTYDAGIKSPSAEGYDVTINGTGNYKGTIVRKFRVASRGTPLLNSAKVEGIKKSYGYEAGVQGGRQADGQDGARGDGQISVQDGAQGDGQSVAARGPKGLEEDLRKLVVKIGNTTLTKDTDYTVRIEKADAVGTGYVVVEAAPTGAYAGEKRIPFNITGTDLKKGSIIGLEKTYLFTGESVEPEIQVYSGKNGAGAQIPADAYTVRYSNCMNPGKAAVTVTGIPEKGYSGSIFASYTIGKYDIGVGKTGGSITVKMPEDIKYAKGGAKPKPVITHTGGGTIRTLRESIDYTLKYSNNTSVNGKNKPTLKITGTGNYCGTVTESYGIAVQDLGSLTITVADKAYNSKKKGSYYYSAPKVYDLDGKQLKQKTDYTVQYFDASTDQEIGKNDAVLNGARIRVTVTAVERGNYTSTLSTTYYVRETKEVKDIAKAKFDKMAPREYTGSEIRPEVSLYMQTGKTKHYLTEKDYEIIGYYNNVQKGTAAILIRGINDYSGVKSITFKITAADNGTIWSGIFAK